VSESVEPCIENVNPVKKRISFDVPWEAVKSELDDAYHRVGKTAKLKGFRSGKIPRNILEKYYSKAVETETVSNLINRHYWDAIRKNKIPVVSQPVIEHRTIESEKSFTFTATVEVEPDIDPVGYTGLDLEKPIPVVTDAEVDASLEQMRQMFAVLENVEEERGIQTGDFVTINFEGSVEGKKLPELKAENFLLGIGTKTFIPGFEEQLLGLNKGGTKDIVVRFPDDYHISHLRGKDAEFSVEIKDLRVKKVPEIDDDFLNNFDKYQSIQDLRNAVKQRIEEEKKKRFQVAFEKSVSNKLLEKNVFEAPEVFVERQIAYMLDDAKNRMVSEGMDVKKAEELLTGLHDQFRDEAIKIVKTSILLDRIARKESITAHDEEVENRIKEFAMQQSQDYETLRKSMEKDGLIENVRSEIVNLKTYEFIEAHANLTLRELEKVEIGGSEK